MQHATLTEQALEGIAMSRGEIAPPLGSWADRAPAGDPGTPVVDREDLYREFQPLVRRLIRQYGDHPELRQDLPGEIFCRFCQLLEAYDPDRGVPLRPYLVRSLTASVYTYARSHWRRQRREIGLEVEAGAFETLQTVDPTQGWDTALLNQEVLRLLPDAIRQLPSRQRQVVIARFYESRSFEEIAESLNIRPATARSLLRHGLNSLRRWLVRTGLNGG